MSTSRTDAAVRARRQATQEMLERVQTALAAMARDHTPVTVAALARTARVSRTFLYQNQQARALIEQATRTNRPHPGVSNSRSRAQPAWRERALNAEDALQAAEGEIRTQRTRIAELLGKIRDLEHDLPEGSLQRIVTENTSLKVQVRQLTTGQQRLQLCWPCAGRHSGAMGAGLAAVLGAAERSHGVDPSVAAGVRGRSPGPTCCDTVQWHVPAVFPARPGVWSATRSRWTGPVDSCGYLSNRNLDFSDCSHMTDFRGGIPRPTVEGVARTGTGGAANSR
jgi:uncharacterized protein DUF6262